MANGKRKNAHNEKRAARFAAEGVTAGDIKYARASYLGDGGGSCCLCDHPIVYNFALAFERPDGVVTFEPVGSQCITDWFEAMPASPERDALLAQVQQLEADIAAEKRQMKRVEALAANLDGTGDVDAADYLRRFVACAVARKSDAARDIVAKVLKFRSFASDKQMAVFGRLLTDAEREARGEVAPSCPQCKGPMVERNSARGPFLGCRAYPRCKGTRPGSRPGSSERKGDGAPKALVPAVTCPDCDGPMRERNGARGPFLGCAAYPQCKGTREVGEAAEAGTEDGETANEAAAEERDSQHASAASAWAARKTAKPPRQTPPTIEQEMFPDPSARRGPSMLRRATSLADVPAAPAPSGDDERAGAPGPGYDPTRPEEDAPF